MSNLQVELAEVEEVMPTLEDQQQVSRGWVLSGKLGFIYLLSPCRVDH